MFSPLYILNFPDDLRAFIEHRVTEEKLKFKTSGKRGRMPNIGNYIIDVLEKDRKEIEKIKNIQPDNPLDDARQ